MITGDFQLCRSKVIVGFGDAVKFKFGKVFAIIYAVGYAVPFHVVISVWKIKNPDKIMLVSDLYAVRSFIDDYSEVMPKAVGFAPLIHIVP